MTTNPNETSLVDDAESRYIADVVHEAAISELEYAIAVNNAILADLRARLFASNAQLEDSAARLEAHQRRLGQRPFESPYYGPVYHEPQLEAEQSTIVNTTAHWFWQCHIVSLFFSYSSPLSIHGFSKYEGRRH